jgi:metal-sulfur cluster biosynthetic enzyme
MLSEAAVLDALGRVLDPELDEAITSLGFVQAVEIDGAAVEVQLRLPTYYCAPNFSYMMVADAREALERVPGVERILVTLVDHHAAEQISEGVASGRDFAATFPRETDDDDLAGLRGIFRGKAFYARLYRLCRGLLDAGGTEDDLAGMRLADLPDGEGTRLYLARRAAVGLDVSPDAPLLVAIDGRVVPPQEVRLFLRRARLFETSIESNGEYCRSLLQFRYGLTPAQPLS